MDNTNCVSYIINWIFVISRILLEQSNFDKQSSLVITTILFPFIMFVSIVFFGIISILLSLKLSTKVAMGVGIGIIISSVLINNIAQTQYIYSTKFNAVGNELHKNNENFLTIRSYYDVNDGKTKYYLSNTNSHDRSLNDKTNISFGIEEFYTPNINNKIEKLWDRGKDNTWIYTLNSFINPISAFDRLSAFEEQKAFVLNLEYDNTYTINELNYNWKIKKIENLNLKSSKNYNYLICSNIDLNVKDKDLEGFTLMKDKTTLYTFYLKQNKNQETTHSSNILREFYYDSNNIKEINSLIDRLNHSDNSKWSNEIKKQFQNLIFLN